MSRSVPEPVRRAFTLALPALVALGLNAALWLRAGPEPLVGQHSARRDPGVLVLDRAPAGR